MSAINDGGPAFPQPCCDTGHAANSPYGIAGGGLSLRDYFASHADQPGFNECYLLAVEQGEAPIEIKPGESMSWVAGKWFEGLPLDKRLRLYTEVRYRIADAMLAARGGAS